MFGLLNTAKQTIQKDFELKLQSLGVPGMRSRLSVQLRLRSSWVRGFEPRVGLCADSLDPEACFGFCVSLSLCPSSPHTLSLSLSKINTKIKNKNKIAITLLCFIILWLRKLSSPQLDNFVPGSKSWVHLVVFSWFLVWSGGSKTN